MPRKQQRVSPNTLSARSSVPKRAAAQRVSVYIDEEVEEDEDEASNGEEEEEAEEELGGHGEESEADDSDVDDGEEEDDDGSVHSLTDGSSSLVSAAGMSRVGSYAAQLGSLAHAPAPGDGIGMPDGFRMAPGYYGRQVRIATPRLPAPVACPLLPHSPPFVNLLTPSPPPRASLEHAQEPLPLLQYEDDDTITSHFSGCDPLEQTFESIRGGRAFCDFNPDTLASMASSAPLEPPAAAPGLTVGLGPFESFLTPKMSGAADSFESPRSPEKKRLPKPAEAPSSKTHPFGLSTLFAPSHTPSHTEAAPPVVTSLESLSQDGRSLATTIAAAPPLAGFNGAPMYAAPSGAPMAQPVRRLSDGNTSAPDGAGGGTFVYRFGGAPKASVAAAAPAPTPTLSVARPQASPILSPAASRAVEPLSPPHGVSQASADNFAQAAAMGVCPPLAGPAMPSLSPEGYALRAMPLGVAPAIGPMPVHATPMPANFPPRGPSAAQMAAVQYAQQRQLMAQAQAAHGPYAAQAHAMRMSRQGMMGPPWLDVPAFKWVDEWLSEVAA